MIARAKVAARNSRGHLPPLPPLGSAASIGCIATATLPAIAAAALDAHTAACELGAGECETCRTLCDAVVLGRQQHGVL